MTDLYTFEAAVQKLFDWTRNSQVAVIYEGVEQGSFSSKLQLMTVLGDAAETDSVIHVRLPGPTTKHVFPRLDLRIDGVHPFEIA